MLRKVQKFASDYNLAFSAIIIGAFIIAASGIALLHGVAQWDLMLSHQMWFSANDNINFYQAIIHDGYTRYADLPFQDSILFRSTAGNGYDFFLMLIAAGWIAGIVGISVLMFGVVLIYRTQVSQLRKKVNFYEK